MNHLYYSAGNGIRNVWLIRTGFMEEKNNG